ncbi:MAG: type 4a pilus biogenesis protein PilO [Terriglobales bacterium]
MSHLRRHLQIAGGVVLACDLALAGWLLSPRAPSQPATRQQLLRAQSEQIALRGELHQLRQLRGRIQTSQQQIQELMAEGIPGEREASSKLLAEFSRIAGTSGVEVSGTAFLPDKKAEFGLRRIAIRLQVAGGYEGAVEFLNGLERSPMFFLINQVSVSGGHAAGAPSEQVRLQVRLEAYEQAGRS